MGTSGILPTVPAGRALPAVHYEEVTRRSNFLRNVTGDHRYIAVSLANGGLNVRWIGPPVLPRTAREFLGNLTASTLQDGHQARWNYTFVEVTVDEAGELTEVESGRTGTATNLRELSHTVEPGASLPWYVWGVQAHSGVSGSAYPAGFRPRPVGGGGTTATHKTDVLVTITERTNAAGELFYTFNEIGSHDGTCT